MRRSTGVIWLLLVAGLFAGPVLGDAGVFTGNGQSLRQITSKKIQLRSIDVTIVPGRGRFLFDGGVGGMDRVEYFCRFELKNQSAQTETVRIGFPVDSQFARDRAAKSAVTAEESSDRVRRYAFIARDDSATYHVEYVHRENQPASSEPGDDAYTDLFTWTMTFEPGQARSLTVQYQMPISMGLVSTSKAAWHTRRKEPELRYRTRSFLESALTESFGYITATGSSWAGKVERATFRVITGPFEKYLAARGAFEGRAADPEPLFPAPHPWWFRDVAPAGWKEIEDGVEWSYADYEPHDPISVRYYVTRLPSRPEEADAFVDLYLKQVTAVLPVLNGPAREKVEAPAALGVLREFMLATWGRAPTDPMVRDLAADQFWYRPVPDFSEANLAKSQKAILAVIDARMAPPQR